MWLVKASQKPPNPHHSDIFYDMYLHAHTYTHTHTHTQRAIQQQQLRGRGDGGVQARERGGTGWGTRHPSRYASAPRRAARLSSVKAPRLKRINVVAKENEGQTAMGKRRETNDMKTCVKQTT
jgi:hypothetical protein